MTTVHVPTTYNITTDETVMLQTPDGKETQGIFVMTQVGGPLDGTIVAFGPMQMGIVLQGMLRLAAWGATEIQGRINGQELLKSVITDMPIESKTLLDASGNPTQYPKDVEA